MNVHPLVVLLALPIACLPAQAFAGSVEPLIEEGHAHARRFDEERALKCFLVAAERDADNPEVLVAIAREYRHLMSEASGGKDKRRLGGIALTYALRAAEVAPEDAEAQLAPAITYGKLLPFLDDNEEKLDTCLHIKAALDKALALDPDNDIAWHILGRWHRGVAENSGVKRLLGGLLYGRLPKSTYENAVACFQKAIVLNPKRLMHHIELGCTYGAMGKDEDAKECIQRGLAMRETEKDDPETKRIGRKVLADLR